MALEAPTDVPTLSTPSWPVRCWLALPDWTFRLLGAGFFLAFLAWEISDYIRLGFWESWLFWEFSKDTTLHLPWARVLIDMTYLLIALAFIFRLPPRSRASRGREIWIPLLGAFWPFLPFAIKIILRWNDSDSSRPYEAFMLDAQMSLARFMIGAGCVVLGNVLDVWGYSVLFNSVSIVAEARELKVTGPYRIVRHPVYLGQILAQGGIWLVFAPFHVVWIAFYLAFVAFQLHRGKVEDTVLERAFGERYLSWKRKTFWFI